MFAGREVALAALRAGIEVTTFNRGVSGQDLDGIVVVRGDRNEAANVGQLAARGPWDAVVDASAYVPRNVLDVARALRPVCSRYVLLSTVSVYAGWPNEPLTEASDVLECPPDAGPDFGVDVENGPTKYGYQKAGCENAVRAVFGDDIAVLRPGVVLGPREYVGRLPWWLGRTAAGGRIVAPAPPERSIQPVDVRDLAAFALRCTGGEVSGAFNVTAPIGRETFGGMLRACAEVTEAEAEFTWVTDEQLLDAGVRQWSELPLWRIADGVWKVDSSRAAAAGLECRPLSETVRDTWAWMTAEDDKSPAHERAGEIGLDPAKEQQILAALSD
ncbi:NAD-dependent epimerase/dehydratase family protein [Flindersiella endophytica]